MLVSEILKGSNIVIKKKIALLKLPLKELGINLFVVYYLNREQNCLCSEGKMGHMHFICVVCISCMCMSTIIVTDNIF